MQLLSEKNLSINEISDHFPISRTAVSKHLRILSEADLVKIEKSGREKIYHLHEEPLVELKEFLASFAHFQGN
ncbi:ArsR/SmtB family transcription factor [Salipaludibacillus sp. HK11]|uniref:ArsR/SmtB family transcription factor n=1 Tax=Salipaludibacillus sp. HK11 TaxID=3394320 RepID=UPI0039FCF049